MASNAYGAHLGGFLGSTYLDEKFENTIKTLLGRKQFDKLVGTKRDDGGIKKALKRKEGLAREIESAKQDYKGDGKDIDIDFPGAKDNSDNGILNEIITLSRKVI